MLKHLGDFVIPRIVFSNLEADLAHFQTEAFRSLGEVEKNERISRLLLEKILGYREQQFLLLPILNYIEQIRKLDLIEGYGFSNFELWLNQFSGLSSEENLRLRGEIMGKWVPREEYQCLFPIGMNRTYPGSHYITAHGSPDLDTTVASFWGWVDAFAARVAEGLHLWNVPEGPPFSSVEIKVLFEDIFGPGIFTSLAKTRKALSLSSTDLMSQKGLLRKPVSESIFSIDHGKMHNAIVLVDDKGSYLGDWGHFDVDGVRQVVMLISSCLRWFQNTLHMRLIALFGQYQCQRTDIPIFIRSLFGMHIRDCEPAKEFTFKQKQYAEDYLIHVLGVKEGLNSTFEAFGEAMEQLKMGSLMEFLEEMYALEKSSLFDAHGKLIENRPRLFEYLEKIITKLDRAIHQLRSYVDTLEVALSIKTEVFKEPPQTVGMLSEIDEIRSKMGSYPYLTVTAPDREGKSAPMGVLHAADIHRNILGTVTLRDFCNREETKIPSYFEVISVIDHHKTSLQTLSAPLVLISDAQSSNVLVAEMAFAINDKYSVGGMTEEEIAEQVKQKMADQAHPRILQRLLQRQMVVQRKLPFFIHPHREFFEYLHFLYAILDDTDLLTKVTRRDVECVASLLNRLKSLMVRQEVEIVHFDDLYDRSDFVSAAASRLLQTSDLYSLCRKTYSAREESVEENIRLCIAGKTSNFFMDTKEQNGCCRVSQTKLFARNYASFAKNREAIRKIWLADAQTSFEKRGDTDFHLHMISTIPGAEDLFAGTGNQYEHQDEIWIWIPKTETAIQHLKSFLNAFQSSPQIQKNREQGQLEVEFGGENEKQLASLFQESFVATARREAKSKLPIAIIQFSAGSINSRKAMITPYLPKN